MELEFNFFFLTVNSIKNEYNTKQLEFAVAGAVAFGSFLMKTGNRLPNFQIARPPQNFAEKAPLLCWPLVRSQYIW